MTQTLNRFFELRAAHKIASDAAYAMRSQIARELDINIADAQNHADYKRLDGEATRLYWEADALTPNIIRANLALLGIEDMEVTGVVMSSDRETRLGEGRMLLSDICGLRYRGMPQRVGVTTKATDFNIIVEKDGVKIGYVDSDGDFDYGQAPDLRTALGWKIVTDGGRSALVESFDLDKATDAILETIKVSGTGRDAFFGAYFGALKSVFVYERTSRFADGYCGAAMTLWRVATRELGIAHPGYDFCY